MNTADVRWEDVGASNEWEAGVGRLVRIGARQIGVYFHGDEWFALKDICPHAGVELHSGRIVDGQIECPAHGWRFDLRTGECDFGASVANYPVQIIDGRVLVGV